MIEPFKTDKNDPMREVGKGRVKYHCPTCGHMGLSKLIKLQRKDGKISNA